MASMHFFVDVFLFAVTTAAYHGYVRELGPAI